jgi:hypothetical protein
MIYRPRHFRIEELVPPDIFEARGERAIELLDVEALITLDALRDRFGTLTVNDWLWHGSYSESGLRRPDTETGATYSQHKYGRAFDCKFARATPREVFDDVLEHDDLFPHLSAIENVDFTETWLHFDTRNHGRRGIWVVNP